MADTLPAQEKDVRSRTRRESLASEVLATVCVVLLALGWFVFPLPLHSPHSAPSPGQPPHLVIEQVDSLTTDPSGRISRRMRADELRRLTPGAKSLLVRPRLTVFPTVGPRWHFEAESGEVSPDGENIYLPGRVQGRRDAVEPLEIDGRDLWLTARDNSGESDKPATVRGASFEARGTGVKIWLEEGRIEFLSDASSVLRPRLSGSPP